MHPIILLVHGNYESADKCNDDLGITHGNKNGNQQQCMTRKKFKFKCTSLEDKQTMMGLATESICNVIISVLHNCAGILCIIHDVYQEVAL